jgi:hypothetical protein
MLRQTLERLLRLTDIYSRGPAGPSVPIEARIQSQPSDNYKLLNLPNFWQAYKFNT